MSDMLTAPILTLEMVHSLPSQNGGKKVPMTDTLSTPASLLPGVTTTN